MPMQRGNVTGVPWHYCDRCGWQYPLDRMTRQRGLLLCLEKCWDQPFMFERDRYKADVLSQPADEQQVHELLREARQELMEY